MTHTGEIVVPKSRGGYTVLANRLLEEGVISARAFGILVYLVSRPDGWTCRVSHLQKIFTEGRDAIYTALKELVRAGYMALEQIADPKRPGLYRARYRMLCDNEGKFPVADSVSADQLPHPENPDPENPDPAFPDPEKPDLNNYRDRTTTEENKNRTANAVRSTGTASRSRSASRPRGQSADAGLDAREIVDNETRPASTQRHSPRGGNADTPSGLVAYFRSKMRDLPAKFAVKTGSINGGALASNFARWLDHGATPEHIRDMIDAFASDPQKYLTTRAWLAFLQIAPKIDESLRKAQRISAQYDSTHADHAAFWGIDPQSIAPFTQPQSAADILQKIQRRKDRHAAAN